MIYAHRGRGTKYLKLLSTKVRIGDNWIDAVLYVCLYWNKSGMFWVRTKTDFHDKFKRI
jgi:hypothetical protein